MNDEFQKSFFAALHVVSFAVLINYKYELNVMQSVIGWCIGLFTYAIVATMIRNR